MKELVKLLCTGVVMMDVPGVKEEEEDGEDDGNGDNEDNGAELHKWLAPIAVQSPLSILLVFFRPSEIGNYAVLVTDPDQWHNMLFFWGLGADLAIESGPVVIMATVFIALWSVRPCLQLGPGWPLVHDWTCRCRVDSLQSLTVSPPCI
eukprot:m.124954 g.124954  ORF g.124954 m.124954 type:complete len:149 (-) comp22098_c0_seq8:286-732(-)